LLFGWLFEASCRRHDFGYARGGSSDDKKTVDKGFRKAMNLDSKELLKNKQYVKYMVAKVVSLAFYLIVATLGWTRFTYGPYQSKEAILKQ